MDFSWLDISNTETKPVNPTVRNTLIVFLLIGVSIIFAVGGLWLPIGARLLVCALVATIVFLAFLKDIVSVIVFGLFIFTLSNRHFVLLDRDIDIFIVFVFFISLLYLIQLAISRKKILVYTRINKYIFIFWAVIIAGIFNSIFLIKNVPLNALHEPLPYLLPPVIFFVIVSFTKTKNEIVAIITVLLVLLFIESIYSILTFLLSVGWQGDAIYGNFTRMKGHFGNPNVLAGWLELILPVAVAFLLSSKKKRERLLLLFPIIAGYFTLILTFSRGGFLLGLGTLGLILISKVRNKLLTAGIVAVFVIGFILGSGYLARQLTIFSYEEMLLDASTIHRVLQYTNYVSTIVRYPILGIGWGSRFDYSTFGEFERSVRSEMKYGHLNSTMFDFGVHNGITGIVAVYLLFIIIAYSFWKNSKIIGDRRLSLISWCLALGILSFIGHSFVDGFLKSTKFSSHLWTLVGLGFAARLAWDNYGEKIDDVGRFKFQIVNPFKKYLRKSNTDES